MCGFLNFLKNYIKGALNNNVFSTSKAKATMVRTKLLNFHTAGKDTSYLTRFTILLVSRTQHYIWTKLDMVQNSNGKVNR